MRAFSKRYFVWFSLIFLAFSGISFKLKNLIFFAVFAILLAVFGMFCRKFAVQKQNLRLVAVGLLISAALGVSCSQGLVLSSEAKIEKYRGEHLVSGYVREASTREEYSCEYLVRVESIDCERAGFDLILVTEYNSELERGDFIEWIGNIIPTQEYSKAIYLRNANGYDYPLACVLKSGAEIISLEKEFRVPLMLSSLNSKLSARLLATLGTKNGSLASALLLGNRELLPSESLRDFKRAGVYHLLALSGLHVAILIGILEWLLKKLLVPIKLRIALLGAASLFYIALTGFALSACRSMLMLWVVYLSMLLQRKRDVMTSLFAAVSVIVLLKPSAALDVGLQLSFLSTLGVICASVICARLGLTRARREKGIERVLKSALRALAVACISSLSVFILTLPVVAICFGEVSLATFFTNLFTGGICEAFMILALLSLVFSGVLFIYPIFSYLAGVTGNFMTWAVGLVADAENVMLSLAYPFAHALVWGLFLSFVIMLALRLKRKWTILLPSAVFALLMCATVLSYNASRSDLVRAEYYYGDGAVLSSSEGVYICDMSDGAFGGLYDGVALAKTNCFTEIDGVILTHYHSEHVISIGRLVKEFKVRSVLLPMPQNDREDVNMRAIVRALGAQGVDAYIYKANEPLDILSGELVMSDRAYTENYAHPSYALTYKNGEQRLTYIGKPYFNTYLEKSRAFADYINESDYLIIGSDGRRVKESFEIFTFVKDECELSFADAETFLLSDYERFISWMKAYFNVSYKKYDLK